MPTYEYLCRDCGHTFEIVQSMKDDGLTVCPECGGQLRKVFGAPMISFKGSGFYATDHGKKSKSSEQKDSKQGADSTSTSSGEDKPSGEKKAGDTAPAAKKESSSESKSESKGESKSESKGESKTTTKKEPKT